MRRVLAILAVAALAGCGTAQPVRTTSAAASPSPRPSQTGTPAPSVAPSDITFGFAGDVHFMDRTATLLKSPATAFGSIAKTLAEPDIMIVNMETSITSRGTPEPKTYHFRTTPKALDAVKAAGIDAISLANNHSLDYGQVGFADTLDAVKAAQMPTFGVGHNATEAYAPWLTTVRGTKIAVLGFSQIHDLADTWAARDDRPGIAMAHDVDRAVAAVAAARKVADIVVVFNHWGTETVGCPNAEQKTFAAKVAAAGADLIIGAHAHVLQGSGWMGKTFVAYGMGNFLWYVGSADTGVLRVTVHGRSVVKQQFVPAKVSGTGQPVLASGTEATRISQKYADLRGCAGLAAAPS